MIPHHPPLRSLLLLLPLLRVVCSAQAQPVLIEGQVRDSLGRAVDFANVYVQGGADSSAVLAFAITGPDGRYRLEVRRRLNRLVLTAGKLSYESHSVILDILQDQGVVKIVLDIQLNSKTYSLKEVIVHTESPPVLVKKDTIVFKAEAFASGNEEVVEDLLRKLPGVEVTEEGAVTVNGKSIEKVLVERDDLFGKGYKLLTQNMSADVVDKVEVLDRYSENPLLKDIENSEKVALNLSLKENRKSTLFGNAEAGYGASHFYESRANLISFHKKTKYYLFSNLNNTGRNPADDFLSMTGGAFFDENPLGDGMSATPLITLTTEHPGLGKKRYFLNNAEFASLNFIYKPLEKLKLKGLAFLDFDEFKLRENNLLQYKVEDIEIREDKDFRHNGRAFSFKLDGICELNEKTRLEYSGSRFHLNGSARRALRSNQRSLTERLSENAVLHQHRLALTRKLSDNRVLQFYARHLTDDKPQEYRIDNFLPGALFPGRDKATEALQRSRHRLSFNGLLGQYIQNVDGDILDIRLRYTHRVERLSSNLSFPAPDGNDLPAGELYTNDASLRLGDLFSSLKYQKQLDPKLSLGGALEIHYLHALTRTGIPDFANSRETTNQGLYLVPKARLSWEPNDKNRLFLSFSRGVRNAALPDIYDRYILNDYRNLSAGAGQFDQLASQYLLLNYTYGGWSKQFLINGSLTAIRDDRYLSTNYRIHPDINTFAKIILKDRNITSLNVSVDRFVETLSGNLKLKTGLSGNAFENILNDSLPRAVRTNTLSYGAEWHSAFGGRFNFHLGTNWDLTFVRRPAFQRNPANFSFLDLLFDLSEKLALEVKQDLYHFPGALPENDLFYFADFDLRFTLRKNAFTMKLSARNLFNTRSFSTRTVDDIQTFSNRIGLFPRYVLLKVNFKF